MQSGKEPVAQRWWNCSMGCPWELFFSVVLKQRMETERSDFIGWAVEGKSKQTLSSVESCGKCPFPATFSSCFLGLTPTAPMLKSAIFALILHWLLTPGALFISQLVSSCSPNKIRSIHRCAFPLHLKVIVTTGLKISSLVYLFEQQVVIKLLVSLSASLEQEPAHSQRITQYVQGNNFCLY